MDRFLLIVAGEASGDILGAEIVRELVSQKMQVRGSGGPLMQQEGMVPLIPWGKLAVNGFSEIIPRWRELWDIRQSLRARIASSECLGVVLVDSPGLNTNLAQWAYRQKKPVIYVAPPQIWAWKPARAKKLRNIPLVVCFRFEQQYWQRQRQNETIGQKPSEPIIHCTHPLWERWNQFQPDNTPKHWLLWYPGSRESQWRRNLQKSGKMMQAELANMQLELRVIAADTQQQTKIKELFPGFEVLCADDPHIQDKGAVAVCVPGTVTLELALRRIPAVVFCAVPRLTVFLGKIWLKTRLLSLPDILLQRKVTEEIIFAGRPGKNEQKKLRSALKNVKSRQQNLENARSEWTSQLQGETLGYCVAELMLSRLKQQETS